MVARSCLAGLACGAALFAAPPPRLRPVPNRGLPPQPGCWYYLQGSPMDSEHDPVLVTVEDGYALVDLDGRIQRLRRAAAPPPGPGQPQLRGRWTGPGVMVTVVGRNPETTEGGFRCQGRMVLETAGSVRRWAVIAGCGAP